MTYPHFLPFQAIVINRPSPFNGPMRDKIGLLLPMALIVLAEGLFFNDRTEA